MNNLQYFRPILINHIKATIIYNSWLNLFCMLIAMHIILLLFHVKNNNFSWVLSYYSVVGKLNLGILSLIFFISNNNSILYFPALLYHAMYSMQEMRVRVSVCPLVEGWQVGEVGRVHFYEGCQAHRQPRKLGRRPKQTFFLNFSNILSNVRRSPVEMHWRMHLHRCGLCHWIARSKLQVWLAFAASCPLAVFNLCFRPSRL